MGFLRRIPDMKLRNLMTTSLLAAVIFSTALFSVPRGEFSMEDHPSLIGSFHVDMNSRDYDPSHPNVGNALGVGFALHHLLTMPGKYSQHKLFYLSFDSTLSGI